jgi:hypothetical protein
MAVFQFYLQWARFLTAFYGWLPSNPKASKPFYNKVLETYIENFAKTLPVPQVPKDKILACLTAPPPAAINLVLEEGGEPDNVTPPAGEEEGVPPDGTGEEGEIAGAETESVVPESEALKDAQVTSLAKVIIDPTTSAKDIEKNTEKLHQRLGKLTGASKTSPTTLVLAAIALDDWETVANLIIQDKITAAGNKVKKQKAKEQAEQARSSGESSPAEGAGDGEVD